MSDSTQVDDPIEALWQEADEAAKKGNILKVLSVLILLAGKGIWQAYARIGEIYEAGSVGVERDIPHALSWYRRAVFEGDDPVAHVGLGRAYYDGAGVERDFSKARYHFQKAFLAKKPEAGIYLGIMHYFGVGAPRDPNKAREYFEFAASSEYFVAYGYLARIEFSRGSPLKAAKLALKGWQLMARITRQDSHDPRLLGIERPHHP